MIYYLPGYKFTISTSRSHIVQDSDQHYSNESVINMEYAKECTGCKTKFIFTADNCKVFLYTKDESSNHIEFTCDTCGKEQNRFVDSEFLIGVCDSTGVQLFLSKLPSRAVKQEALNVAALKKKRPTVRASLSDKDWARVARFKKALNAMDAAQISELAKNEPRTTRPWK